MPQPGRCVCKVTLTCGSECKQLPAHKHCQVGRGEEIIGPTLDDGRLLLSYLGFILLCKQRYLFWLLQVNVVIDCWDDWGCIY